MTVTEFQRWEIRRYLDSLRPGRFGYFDAAEVAR